MELIDLSGIWQVTLENDSTIYEVKLPGTLDENCIGHKDLNTNAWNSAEVSTEENHNNEWLRESSVIKTRFTRKYTFEGEAVFSRTINLPYFDTSQRVFLEVERSRHLRLSINQRPILSKLSGTVSTPFVFEVTDYLEKENDIALACSNTYPEWPRDEIVYSSAASDETQTNWNGLLGYVRLRIEKENFIANVRVYPIQGQLNLEIDIDARKNFSTELCISSNILTKEIKHLISVEKGQHTIYLYGLSIVNDLVLWDEFLGNLYELNVSSETLDSKRITFGYREFSYNQSGFFTINGRSVFLRSETNCCVFPETGHMPLTTSEWKEILGVYQSYGVNCVRFHSHCPPEAAFSAADQLGMFMQPELSQWNPKTSFESKKSYEYYRLELLEILRIYANHPSFVMLTFGNESHANDTGHENMHELLANAKAADVTRLYANGSNVHYGSIGTDEHSDFYTSSNFFEHQLRGTFSGMAGYINEVYPNTRTNYVESMQLIRNVYKKPVFSFEVGQFEVLPDFDEIKLFKGVTIPNNFIYIQEQVTEKGFAARWRSMVEATGEIAAIAYREEIEAALRTKTMSGISLLGLQDFPGQGTALVGMIDSHMRPKSFEFAHPEKFKQYFNQTVPLLLMDKYTYTAIETFTADIEIAHYGMYDLTQNVTYKLYDLEKTYTSGIFKDIHMLTGTVTSIGRIELSLESFLQPKKLFINISVNEFSNDYPIWIYPVMDIQERIGRSKVIITRNYSEMTEALSQGKTVLYTPKADADHFPNSVQSQFTTDFWSVGTFANQSGCMGCLIDSDHDVFRNFPTETHSNWQWWPMTCGRAVIVPESVEPIVTVMDSYARLRKMSLLFECRYNTGKLMVSSMGILEQLQYPESNALLASILDYMESEKFEPNHAITREELCSIFEK